MTLSIDDEVQRRARRKVAAMGTSVNQFIREYLEQLAGDVDLEANAAEFERLSRLAHSDS